MSKYTQMTFIAAKKPGVVSFLMLNAGKIGLLYDKRFERYRDEETSEIVVYYSGITNLSNEQIKESFEKHSGIIEVTDISITDISDMRKRPRPDVVSAA